MHPFGDGLPFSVRDLDTVKAAVAALGTALLVAGIWMRRRPALAPGWRRAWDLALALLGLAGALCWTNLLQFNFPGFGHPSETFHYYLGAKYFPELGYTRLYRCVAVAEAGLPGGAERVASRSLRNLETNVIESTAEALAHPGRCTRHFTPERWIAFQRDLAWFRDRPNPRRWRVLQLDHGYNATPVWGLFGRLLAAGGPATDAKILALRLIDPVLLVLSFGLVSWTFGWRTLCVALLFFGTHYPAQYGWTGGSYLRQLDLAALLAGLCLLKRGRLVAGGGLLALAALVRIHPVFLLVGPGLQVAGQTWRARRLRLDRAQRRLVAGVVAGAALLLPAAAVVTGGFGAWVAFAENSRVLIGTPLRNHMGLPTLLAWDAEKTAQRLMDPSLPDPYLPWKEARRATFAERRPAYLALVAGFVALLAWAVQRQPIWVAAVLGAGLVPIAAELTGYYTALLVVFALLWERAPPVGAGLVGLAAAGWLVVDLFQFFDAIFTWLSLLAALYVLFATVWIGWGAPREVTRPPGVG